MPSASPRLALPFLQPAQAQKHVTHNEALQILDALVQLRVESFDGAEPPAAPRPGDVHAVGPQPTGDWSGEGGRLALWDGTGWQFLAPQEGWLAWDAAQGGLRVLTGGAWAPAAPALQDLPGLGVGTESDAVNRLAVAGDATLLTHAGGGHQLKVNKAGAADTASLLFQSGWTGHAEMGLAGDLDFAVKVSDGAAWRTALSAARGTGVVTLPQGAHLGGPLTGAAVQAAPTDAAPGRVLTVGAFGLGGALPPVADVSDPALVSGLYAYDADAGSTGGPAGLQRGALVHLARAGGAAQAVVAESGTSALLHPGLVLSRVRTGGGWSPWTPAGVAESLEGQNGRALRQPDGTQTCWHGLATSASADTVWTFPRPFASAQGLAVTAGLSGGTTAVGVRVTARSATSATVAAVDASGARVAATVDLVALGRWA